MKKTYIKPNLQIEMFECDTIMTQTPSPTPLAASSINLLQGTVEIDGGTINFNDNNTLHSIDYKNFMQ